MITKRAVRVTATRTRSIGDSSGSGIARAKSVSWKCLPQLHERGLQLPHVHLSHLLQRLTGMLAFTVGGVLFAQSPLVAPQAQRTQTLCDVGDRADTGAAKRPARAAAAEPRDAHVPGHDEEPTRRSCSSTRASTCRTRSTTPNRAARSAKPRGWIRTLRWPTGVRRWCSARTSTPRWSRPTKRRRMPPSRRPSRSRPALRHTNARSSMRSRSAIRASRKIGVARDQAYRRRCGRCSCSSRPTSTSPCSTSSR